METKKTKLQTLRQETIGAIVDILRRHKNDDADFALSSTPIISEDPLNDYNTYTLDRIILQEDSFSVDASSSGDTTDWSAEDLSTDVLINILEWLENYEETIWAETETEDTVYVLSTDNSEDGISESEIIDVYRDRLEARKELARRKAIFIDGLDEDELPEKLNPECDGYTDTPDNFAYYMFQPNHAFSLKIEKKKII